MALNREHALKLLNQERVPLNHDDIVEIPEEEQMNDEQFEKVKQAMNVE